jgi:SAM-dependent methyltransferase
MGMLDDLRRRDPLALHRFLWSNHLAYAATYEVSRRFGAANINPTRHALFDSIAAQLRSRGLDPRKDIRSVLEIGCSQGYLLHHLEASVFPSATILHGLDIDAYAVRQGSAHLRSIGSAVKLFAADLEAAEHIIGNAYDVVLCCGVLMYVDKHIAERAIRTMFSRAAHVVGLICLAAQDSQGRSSAVRASDGAFVHDMDPMIRRAGGRVLSRDWIGTHTSGSSPSDVIVAEPVTALDPAHSIRSTLAGNGSRSRRERGRRKGALAGLGMDGGRGR